MISQAAVRQQGERERVKYIVLMFGRRRRSSLEVILSCSMKQVQKRERKSERGREVLIPCSPSPPCSL